MDERGTDARTRATRWRLVLGAGAEQVFGAALDTEDAARDQALGFLYDREGAGRNVRPDGDRAGKGPGSLDDSALTVPDWINQVHRLFPARTIERLERDALERYELTELVTDPGVLRRVQPSMTLLKAVLHTKHLMSAQVLAEARKLVRSVIDQLLEHLARPVASPFTGVRDPRRRSMVKIARNFDAAETIRRNLAHWDPERHRLVIEQPRFTTRVRRHLDRWQLITLVDQSGSMAGSVIHAAVTASIFHGIQSLRTHLVAFDTNVVDLSADCGDPVETLLKVQLGGGTDIAQALTFATQLVATPRRTIVVLISDLYEGGSGADMLRAAKRLVDSGVTLLCLAALDEEARPDYDRQAGRLLADLGAHVGAMTPGELAAWVAEKVG
jgi:Mg-chelatase subunit ChlD